MIYLVALEIGSYTTRQLFGLSLLQEGGLFLVWCLAALGVAAVFYTWPLPCVKRGRPPMAKYKALDDGSFCAHTVSDNY